MYSRLIFVQENNNSIRLQLRLLSGFSNKNIANRTFITVIFLSIQQKMIFSLKKFRMKIGAHIALKQCNIHYLCEYVLCKLQRINMHSAYYYIPSNCEIVSVLSANVEQSSKLFPGFIRFPLFSNSEHFWCNSSDYYKFKVR